MANVLTFGSDLIFTSKISSAARAVGATAASASSPAALEKALESGDTRVVLVDMSMPLMQAAQVIEAARGRATTIAFYSHVQADQRAAAESAGAHRVLPRSQFVAELPAIVASAVTPGH